MDHRHEYSEQDGKWVCECGKLIPDDLLNEPNIRFNELVEIIRKNGSKSGFTIKTGVLDFTEHREG
ncbi:hypothetical protein J2736_006716 [Paenibacillus qinlingensis]|uniref:Uncharacterized protein n=1 Tax=Paenibacillus qinlingensis TaxID=1837343 RepID=A0ABU1P7C0_9BACL|nr:hypothetical protein [Paenibacillus qinlingensis]